MSVRTDRIRLNVVYDSEVTNLTVGYTIMKALVDHYAKCLV